MKTMNTLKEQVLAYIEIVRQKGESIGSYACPSCGKSLMTTVPNKKDDVWDSAVTCYECDDMHFVVKTMAGVTASKLA
jgi:hypothetical protein